jgi:hypothetical protein
VTWDDLCPLEHWLQIGAVVCGIAAAALWFWASRTKVPAFSREEMQATYSTPVPALVTLVGLINRQSKLNALAALFAALAAICQVPAALLPVTCWSGPPWPFSSPPATGTGGQR